VRAFLDEVYAPTRPRTAPAPIWAPCSSRNLPKPTQRWTRDRRRSAHRRAGLDAVQAHL
jgi:hypothetical protein